MFILETVCLMFAIAALLSFLCHKFLKLPAQMSILITSIATSAVFVALSAFGTIPHAPIDISRWAAVSPVFNFILCCMLFSATLRVNINDYWDLKLAVTALGFISTAIFSLAVGSGLWWLFNNMGLTVSFPFALLCGAALGIMGSSAAADTLRNTGTSKFLQNVFAGEALTNAFFALALGFSIATLSAPGAGLGALAFKLLGSLALGAACGYGAYKVINDAKIWQFQIFLTVALVAGLFALAQMTGLSSPLAVMAAAVFLGNHGKMFDSNPTTKQYLTGFWDTADIVFNTLIFALAAAELMALAFTQDLFIVALISVPLVMAARFAGIFSAITLLKPVRHFMPKTAAVLTWAGLRAGLPLAAALALPDFGPANTIILALVFVNVFFSLTLQGLSVEKILISLTKTSAEPEKRFRFRKKFYGRNRKPYGFSNQSGKQPSKNFAKYGSPYMDA